MRYYSVVYLHFSGSLCEWCRFSTEEAAERCAEFLHEASVGITGDLDRKFFNVVKSMEFEEWPADCVGQLEVDAFLSFE